ncbi:hypothetical protein BJ165DRAFT_1532555 [Panaeolus papilionaceus]|nr:hypothetical protein BJ165DRAFT_1532555 [Panaeolus papilionaceus]
MADRILCACGCNQDVTFPTQRNHLERCTGNHGMRAQIAEETQDLQHAFLEGLTRKRRQEEALHAQARKRRRRRGRAEDNSTTASAPHGNQLPAGCSQNETQVPSQGISPSSQPQQPQHPTPPQQPRTSHPPPAEHSSHDTEVISQPGCVNEAPHLDGLLQGVFCPAPEPSQDSIAQSRVQSVSQLCWVRRRRRDDSEHEELMADDDGEENEDEQEEGRDRALPGELVMRDIPPLMEVSDDEDEGEDNNSVMDNSDERWDEVVSPTAETAAAAPPPVLVFTSNEDEQAAATYFREQFERDAAKASTLAVSPGFDPLPLSLWISPR